MQTCKEIQMWGLVSKPAEVHRLYLSYVIRAIGTDETHHENHKRNAKYGMLLSVFEGI